MSQKLIIIEEADAFTSISKDGLTQSVREVVKNSPFFITASLDSSSAPLSSSSSSSSFVRDLRSASTVATLHYAPAPGDTELKTVSFVKKAPFSSLISVLPCGTKARVELRLHALTSQHEGSYFVVRVAIVDTQSGAEYPNLSACTQPIKTISKPKKRRKNRGPPRSPMRTSGATITSQSNPALSVQSMSISIGQDSMSSSSSSSSSSLSSSSSSSLAVPPAHVSPSRKRASPSPGSVASVEALVASNHDMLRSLCATIGCEPAPQQLQAVKEERSVKRQHTNSNDGLALEQQQPSSFREDPLDMRNILLQDMQQQHALLESLPMATDLGFAVPSNPNFAAEALTNLAHQPQSGDDQAGGAQQQQQQQQRLSFETSFHRFLQAYQKLNFDDRSSRIRKLMLSLPSRSKTQLQQCLDQLARGMQEASSTTMTTTTTSSKTPSSSSSSASGSGGCDCVDCPHRRELERIDGFYSEFLTAGISVDASDDSYLQGLF
jgi:hypothetical protein